MVSPVFLIALPLLAAFPLGLLPARQRDFAYSLTLATLALTSLIAADWLRAFAFDGLAALDIHTAGTPPPFGIALRMGLPEAALALLINVTGLLAAVQLKDALFLHGRRAMAVLLVLVMALSGIVLTRDLFNLFVFFELVSIATGGLLLIGDDRRAAMAGFKYLLIAQVIAIFLLIGIIFAYHATGTLNIDDLALANLGALTGGALAAFLLLAALLAELKPFPANGWALDIYETAPPAFSALFSAATGAAALFAFDKVMPLGGPIWPPLVVGVGLLTFLGGNLFALPQTNDRRLLGYSSIAQIGLILATLGLGDLLGADKLFIIGGLLLSHAVAKAGLYWLSDLIARRDLSAWAALRERPWLLFAFVCFLAMLIGLPPFPGFYAKWDLIHRLAADGQMAVVAAILLGALLEAGYLFRWFGAAVKGAGLPAEADAPGTTRAVLSHQVVPVLAALLGAWALAFLWGALSGHGNLLLSLPLLFALAFLLLERWPVWIKNSLAIAGLVGYFLLTLGDYDPLRLIFAAIFLPGGAVILLASYQTHGQRIGFYPSAMLMYAGLALLIGARDSFGFFAAWEFLTIGSYFLILRGARSEPHALSYLLFSLGGAFLILAGFALAANGVTPFPLTALAEVAQSQGSLIAPWVFLLLAVGFMTKTAAIGLHIWLPGAHAEAETDVSPMVSGILLKAGLYGLMVLMLAMGRQQFYGVDLIQAMLWIGALSALIGNLMAAFQEDAKRLLAWSSIGQMGYAMFGLALFNHLGWLMALMFVINHYVYKSMLFLAVGGVAKRTGTREMYRMGGLIKLMPLSFIAVMIGIIAVSGVPPLSGFGGRWIFYNAILASDARLPIALIFLSGPIAFLYLFRLIHTIFLGQLKDEHRRVKEAPFWIILPQMLYVAVLMVVAVVPGLVLRHVDNYLTQFFPEGALNWSGLTIISDYGYWSPVSIMLVIGVIFMTLFIWLLFINRRAQPVKQFNIVFAGERPHRPETTHFAWNFFAPYRKALGFLTLPLATRFWAGVTDGLHTAGDLGRRFYTGDGQTYAIQLIGFIVVLWLVWLGVAL